MSATDFPSFTDGSRGVRSPVLKNYNVLVSSLPQQYHYIDDDIKGSSLSLDHILEGDGEHLGGFTRKSIVSGTLNLQLDSATDTPPDVAHIIGLTKGSVEGFYVVRDVSAPGKRNDVVRPSLTVTRVVNPVLTGLLSADEGDTLRYAYSIAGGDKTIDVGGKNFRTGSTAGYTATSSDGSALPTGVTINATTGVISIASASAVAGAYDIAVTATDTLANKTTHTGLGRVVITVAA